MTRTADDRVRDVRRLLDAADRVYRERGRLVPGIAKATGLTEQGVDLGFASLERSATDDDLRALVAAAGSTERVHVVLSANVFVAPLRALALARAAAERVTVRPSPRDPLLTEALVAEAGDPAMAVVAERDVGALDCTAIHVYGRDATLDAIRGRARPGVVVRGHGAGLGVAVVTEAADVERAGDLIASDVVPFDQRGCLSPRVAIALGERSRAERLAAALDRGLFEWRGRVPRGALLDEERAEAVRWQETMRFAGEVVVGTQHAVGLGNAGGAIVVPPSGRHVFVGSAATWEAFTAAIAPIARFVVVVGSDDPARAKAAAPTGARVSALGRMQQPPLDGPVDTRPGRQGS